MSTFKEKLMSKVQDHHGKQVDEQVRSIMELCEKAANRGDTSIRYDSTSVFKSALEKIRELGLTIEEQYGYEPWCEDCDGDHLYYFISWR